MYPRLALNSLHSLGWPLTSGPLACISRMLVYQAHGTKPCLCGTEDEAQHFMHARQALSYVPAPSTQQILAMYM